MTTESTGSEQGTMGMEMPSDVERAGKQSERVSVKASDNQSEPVAMRTSFVQSEPVGVNASDNQVASVDLNHQSEAGNCFLQIYEKIRGKISSNLICFQYIFKIVLYMYIIFDTRHNCQCFK